MKKIFLIPLILVFLLGCVEHQFLIKDDSVNIVSVKEAKKYKEEQERIEWMAKANKYGFLPKKKDYTDVFAKSGLNIDTDSNDAVDWEYGGTNNISTTAFLPDAADGMTLGSPEYEFSDLYLADGGVIYGQNGQSNTLTSGASGWTANLNISAATLTSSGAVNIIAGALTDDSVQNADIDWDDIAYLTESGMPIDFALTSTADAGDQNITSVAHLYGVDTDTNADDEIDMSTDDLIRILSAGVIDSYAPNIKWGYDTAAYWNLAVTDGGGGLLSMTSDGTDTMTFGDGSDDVGVMDFTNWTVDSSGNAAFDGTMTAGTSTATLSTSTQTVVMTATGGTYNESLIIDLDTANTNEIGLSSGTGATRIQSSIGYGSLTPVTDSTADFAANFTGANLYGGTFIANADDGDLQLPLMGIGMNFCIITKGAIQVVAATNANDGYLLDGVDTAEDNSVVNTSTSGDIACFQYYTADDWLITTNGWSTE